MIKMDGFVKIPNTVYELGLTPSQFTVLCNLIRVQSYREYKGEVEDGWFAKSQNELAKECGFKSRKTLTKVLNTMVKNTIVNYTIDKTDVTKFKITIANNTIAENTIDTMVKNTIPAMVNFTTLHNNSNKNKEQDNSINPDMTVDTSTSSNNKTHNVEKEKEQYDVNILPVTEGTTKKSKEYYIKCFEEGCGKGLEPTVDQITGFVVKNNVSFDWKDFETTVYQGHKVGDKYQASLKNLGFSALTKLRPMKVKVEEGGYGYSFSSDTKSVQEFMKMYVESDKHQDLNIIVENNN